MMPSMQTGRTLPLTPDELLTTTRSVRKRLDFSRPVERAVIEECLNIAVQAPNASNMQNWHFVVITDPAKRCALGEIYRKAWNIYLTLPLAAPNLKFDDPARNATQVRVTASAQYLADHLQDVPVHVIPCLVGRMEGQPRYRPRGTVQSTRLRGVSCLQHGHAASALSGLACISCSRRKSQQFWASPMQKCCRRHLSRLPTARVSTSSPRSENRSRA